MRIFISFSGRNDGNCDRLAAALAEPGDRIVPFRALYAHSCSDCGYACFCGDCPFRSDGVYQLYDDMMAAGQVVLLVPMYCDNPASHYFIFNERSQDYFMHNDGYDALLSKMYIIGIYGSAEASSDFLPTLSRCFCGTPHIGHVTGVERHCYPKPQRDMLWMIDSVVERLSAFLAQES